MTDIERFVKLADEDLTEIRESAIEMRKLLALAHDEDDEKLMILSEKTSDLITHIEVKRNTIRNKINKMLLDESNFKLKYDDGRIC